MNKVFMFFILLCITKLSFAELACENIDYYAIYEPISYTCEEGFFLPANTTSCQECPEHFICNGGTFKFNKEKFQGLKIETIPSTTMNNLCAINFPVDLYSDFQPVSVSLTWNDNNGNTTQTTCTYDGLINLPPEPAPRPGYAFKGWKLVTND